LDDVQYSKNSYYNRNRYPANNTEGFGWLTLPIRKEKLSQLLKDSYFVDDSPWRKKQLTTIQCVYGRHQYFKDFYPVLEGCLLNTELKTLADLAVTINLSICNFLGIEREFYRSSELNVEGERSDRLLTLCKKFDCDIYLSPAGAKDYIEADGVLLNSEIEVRFQNFNCALYEQKGINNFVPYMSMIDVIFNLGPEGALNYISAPINSNK
jgi:hypothetical protein